MRRILLAVALAALPAQAEVVERNWKAVAGRPDVLVDMASIRSSRLTNPDPNGPPPWDTAVTIKFKGRLVDQYMVDCRPGTTIDQKDGEYRDNGRLIGYTPDAKIWAMVCAAKRLH